MKKHPWLFVGLVLLLSGTFTFAARQEGDGPPFQFEPAFSAELMQGLDYPVLRVRETGTGLEGIPDTLQEGYYRVVMQAPASTSAYFVLVQHPKSLSKAQAEEQLLDATYRDRIPEGWVYGGGTFVLPGRSIEFIVHVPAGEWSVGSVRTSVRPTGGCGGADKNAVAEDWAALQPLRVSKASPRAEPPSSVTLEMKDFSFTGIDRTLPAGPQLWKVTNTGNLVRHLIFFRTPTRVTAEDLPRILLQPPGQPPPDGLPAYSDFRWAGDAAVTSPGYSTWIEFTLQPGHYLATCWLSDPETDVPAAFMGMAYPITVE